MIKRTLSAIFAITGWFAVIAQYVLMMENRVAPVAETTVRFFNFFTILTNTMVAVYFSYQTFPGSKGGLNRLDQPGSLTAITVYITIVGLVYQLVLRQLWHPAGLHIVDELLHSVIPVCVIFFRYLYERKSEVTWRRIPKWLIYPVVYLVYVLIRGGFSGFYPYPFVDVAELGIQKVALNVLVLLGVFLFVSLVFVGIGKRMYRHR